MSKPGTIDSLGVSHHTEKDFGLKIPVDQLPVSLGGPTNVGGSNRDMGSLVLFLVSNFFVNGETVLIDGGVSDLRYKYGETIGSSNLAADFARPPFLVLNNSMHCSENIQVQIVAIHWWMSNACASLNLRSSFFLLSSPVERRKPNVQCLSM